VRRLGGQVDKQALDFVVQAFQKVFLLKPLAPTQSEPPFVIA
jgi:hypothetical protein